MRSRLETRVAGGFLLALGFLLAIGVVSFRGITQLTEAARLNAHTQEVLTRLASLLSTTTDIQTGQRGYVITGAENFLEPYHAGVARADDEFRQLRALTADDPSQQQRLQVLHPLVAARLQFSKEAIELRRTQGFEAARRNVASGKGKEIHDRIRSVIAEMEREELRLRDQRAQRTRESTRFAHAVITGGGTLAFATVSIAMLLTLGDLRARLRAEEALRTRNEELRVATGQAQSADRLKSAFLASMSHELRTPLNSIMGFTGILLKELAGPLNPEQAKQLGMVQGSARHLLALINDVLDLSKIEAGELKVSCESFDLSSTIQRVADVVRPLAERKGLTLRVEGTASVGPLTSDPRRVEQVLLNLLSNAIKFTERGAVTLSAEVAPGAVHLRVSDTGIGIKAEDQALLFRPFRQLDDGLARRHEGTGLGLAICSRLAGLLGGRIALESRWGEGTIVTFTMPVQGALAS